MNYTKVSFTINPNSSIARDILTAELAQFDFDSFEETKEGLNAYIPTSSYNADDIRSIHLINSDEFDISFENEEMPEQNWNETWEKHFFNPIIIDNRCIVRSPFHTDVPKAEYDLLIEPKMAFGTGHHETTGLMIKHILDIDFKNKSVLDMGCGTGILGILCAKKEAKNVLGIDIEEWAFNNANENIQLNNVQNMQVLCGDATLLGEEKYDIILANINRNILLDDIKNYVSVLKDGGTILLSGFYNKDIDVIEPECIKNNLKKIGIKEDNNWVAIAYIHSKE